MTPDGIADWHDRQAADEDTPIYLRGAHRNAAATIRELEASNKTKADIIYAQAKASEIDRAKLKIAMEALEATSRRTQSPYVREPIRKALELIKSL